MAPAHPKHAHCDHDVLDLIRERWSPRAFDPARRISREDIWRLFEAARWTPSSRNEQPWRFILVDRVDHQQIHEALTTTLTASNQAWAPLAPVLILVAAKLTVGESVDANRHAFYDTGQAVAFLTLQAQAQGLGARQMEGFDRVRAAAICDVPEQYDLAAVIAVGYPGAPDLLPNEKHRLLETAPRARRPASDFVFAGKWATRL